MDEALVTQLRILKLSEIKPNFSELSRQYDIDRRTIKRYYDGYEGKPRHHDKSSKLDNHQDLIIQKLGIKGANLRAVYEYIITEVDSDIGTYSNFCKYAKSRDLKPKKSNRGHPRFETPPGKQAQVDWKEDVKIANKYGEMFEFQVFDYKLGYSRYTLFTYKKYRTRQDVIESLIASFKATGGAPKEILFDNMTSVVHHEGNRRIINNKIKAFAKDFGFKIKLCKPYHPFTKGKVESVNKFMKWIIPYEGEFETEEELIAIIEKINKKVNQYKNRETQMPPLLLFQNEKECLHPLPSKDVMDSYLKRDRETVVGSDSLITYDNKKYSVPPEYIDKEVSIRKENDEILIYYEDEIISTHEEGSKRLNYKDEHYKQLLIERMGNVEVAERLAEKNLRLMDQLL